MPYNGSSEKIQAAADPTPVTTDAVTGEVAEPSVEAAPNAGDSSVTLDPEKFWAGRIRSHLEAGVAGYIAAGLEAIQAKRDLKKRAIEAKRDFQKKRRSLGSISMVEAELGANFGFVHMIEAELGENIDAVEKWMAIARNSFLAESANLRILPTAWTTLYVLSSLEPKVLEELAETGRLHSKIKGAEATALVRSVRASNSNGRKRDRSQGPDRDEVNDQGDGRDEGRGDDGRNEDHGEDHGEDHEQLDHGSVHDQSGEVHAATETASPTASQTEAGPNSREEIERRLARADELEREARVCDLKIFGLENEVEELRARLGAETRICHQRNLFRRALETLQKSDAPKILDKDRRALEHSAVTDLLELVRSLTRDGLTLKRIDLFCRPEAH